MNERNIKYLCYGNITAPSDWQTWRLSPFNRFYYILGGDAYYIAQGQKTRLEPRRAYLFTGGADYSLVQDNENRLEHLFFDFAVCPPLRDSRIIKIDPIEDGVVGASVKILLDLIPSGSRYYGLTTEKPVIEDYFSALFGYLCRKYSLAFFKNPAVERALDFIHKNYRKRLRVSDVARHVCLNEQYFIRLFGRYMSASPYSYIRQLRLSKAISLISQGFSLSDAANLVGYEDSASLCHALRNFREAGL